MSNTNVFELTYRSGAKETIVTDAQTVEDQCNRTFGMTVDEAAEFGASVVLVGPYDPEAGAQEELERGLDPDPRPEPVEVVDPQPDGAAAEAEQPEGTTAEAEQPVAQPSEEPQP